MKLLAVVISAMALVACGGGGGGSSSTSTSTGAFDLAVVGTAATGIAIPGATVSAKCSSGAATSTTQPDGSYRLDITNGQRPCLLEITNPVDGTKLHSVVVGSGNSPIANITPLTEMTTARLLGSDTAVFFATFDAAAASQKINTSSVSTAQADVSLVLTGTVDTTTLSDFISTPLKAATQSSPTSGDAQDKLLDALRVKLTSAQIGVLSTALATNQTTGTIKQTVAGMVATTATPPTARAGAAQSVITGTTVTLDASTSTAATGITLTYAWTLNSKPTGSAATLVSPNSPKPTFVADAAGSYVASVIVNDGTTASAPASITVVASAANAAPVANAGVAQVVVAGNLVTLDGSASSDANNDPLTYAWTLTSKPTGSAATLSSSTSVKPTFTADIAGTFVAKLVVNDGKVNSVAVTTSITAAVLNIAPVANAGGIQNVVAGNLVTLDGSASSDANSDPLTYAWTLTSKPTGSASALSSSTSIKPTFTADTAGTYVATLIVNDGKVNSSPSTTSITAAMVNKLVLSEVPTSPCFINCADTVLTLPYSTNAAANANTICVGSCPTTYTVDSLKLSATGQTYTIVNLQASNLTTGSKITPLFSGLVNGQTILAGQVVAFSLQSPFTLGANVNLKYSFTVQETGDTFSYIVLLHTN